MLCWYMLVSLAHVESSLTDLIEVTPKIDHNNFLFIISIFKANNTYDHGNVLS